ncbi:MAG: hypothetical protein GX033_01265 [Firmicutes bacterium]|nr:hypothetical protein [Bacillota bacterium]
MSAMWFKQAARGRGSAGADKTFRITFTDRPKGVRLNAAFTKHLVATDVKYVQIGVEEDLLLVKPIAEKKDNFKLIVNKNSGQVCSTQIGNWAAENGLIKQRAAGVWNSERQLFEFNLGELLQSNPSKEQQIRRLATAEVGNGNLNS